MASPIVSEVVKHLEVMPPDLQTQVLNFVRRLDSTRERHVEDDSWIPSVAEVVSQIKAMPPNTAMIREPQGSLADALRDGPDDPDFDLEQWEKDWAAAEAELKRINLEDDIATGRI